ncbi:serine/threonine-protein kinase [Jiella marina]|uniref:hypothetical protein n=1 Tax=Jiella sp. LLJ827 TaxID=2917712 RepID=UPI0021013309|nr:hypothetical protein [Jiella sp. LLJ827]MCQ0989378.1 hypothetical protein [Jiella sp. LLJ827]
MASAIEKSLRRALEKGDAQDPDFRLQIYEAAERALVKLEATNDTDSAAADAHRRDLIAAIEAIEADFAGTTSSADDDGTPVPVTEPVPVETDPSPPSSATSAPPALGTLAADDRAAEFDPSPDEGDAPEADPRETRKKSRGGRALVAAVILLLLAFLVGAAVWIALPFFTSVAPDRAAEPAAEQGALSIEDAISEGGSGVDASVADVAAESGWTALYSPQEFRELANEEGTIALAEGTGERTVIRISAPADGGEVQLPISGDIARRFGGQAANGELIVGSPDGQPREFALRCLFGGETVCGRQRFTTSLPEENFLFQMQFPPEAVAGGQIAIDPAVGANGQDILLFGVQLRAEGASGQ